MQQEESSHNTLAASYYEKGDLDKALDSLKVAIVEKTPQLRGVPQHRPRWRYTIW